MTAPAVPLGQVAGRTRRGGAVGGRERFAGVIEAAFRGHATLVYLFLYAPILVVVAFSFNNGRFATQWEGFGLRWFEQALRDSNVQKALTNSLQIAAVNAVLATAFGTMAALALQRVGKRLRLAFDALTYVSVIVPEIVIALSTLVLYGALFDALNPLLAALQGNPAKPFELGLGQGTVVAAHVLFNTSLVLLLVRARLSGMDRTHVEASYDLYATPWATFRQVTLPFLFPAILAGFLLAFTFSFDDFVITFFTSGPGSTTLPLYIFGQVRRGVTPLTNAIAAMMLAFTLTVLVVGLVLYAWTTRRTTGKAAQPAAMTGLVAE